MVREGLRTMTSAEIEGMFVTADHTEPGKREEVDSRMKLSEAAGQKRLA